MSDLFKDPASTFKTPNGKYYTKGLFLELSYSKPDHVIFTLKEDDHKGYLSLSKIYAALTLNDPTEYTFAMSVFGSWDNWLVLSNAWGIKDEVLKWRRTNEVRIRSEAIQAIALEMNSGGKSSFTAAKLLLDRGWLDKDKMPSKSTTKRKEEEAKMDKEAMSLLSEDATRLGLN